MSHRKSAAASQSAVPSPLGKVGVIHPYYLDRQNGHVLPIVYVDLNMPLWSSLCRPIPLKHFFSTEIWIFRFTQELYKNANNKTFFFKRCLWKTKPIDTCSTLMVLSSWQSSVPEADHTRAREIMRNIFGHGITISEQSLLRAENVWLRDLHNTVPSRLPDAGSRNLRFDSPTLQISLSSSSLCRM